MTTVVMMQEGRRGEQATGRTAEETQQRLSLLSTPGCLSFFLALLRERVTSCLLVVFRALTLTLTTGAAVAVAHNMCWLAVQAA